MDFLFNGVIFFSNMATLFRIKRGFPPINLSTYLNMYCAWLIKVGRKQIWIYQGHVTGNFENEAEG